MASILLRRGPTVDRLQFTPLTGEIIFDTTEKKVYVGDGQTPGGLKISSDIVLEDGNLFNIPNSSLENSTISGVPLGSNLFNLTAGSFLQGGPYNGGSAVTLSVNASSSNSTNNIVARDASGNFSATTITANLNGNAATVTNGVYTNQTYYNPSWLATLSETKVLPSQDTKNGKYLRTNGTNTYWDEVFPSQIGNSGKFLTTNGTSVGWASAGAIGFPSIVGNDQKFLKVNGTDIVWDFIPSAANGALTLTTSGLGISGSTIFTANQSTNGTFTVTSNATSDNTPSTIVYRDSGGGFSAGNINVVNITSSGIVNAAGVISDLTGSVLGADSSVIVDAATSTLFGKLNGNVISSNTGSVIVDTSAATAIFTGNLTGNADTVTNGVVTTGSYANPSWITALSISQGGTGASTQITALTNLLPTGEQSGYVLKTTGRGTYFWAAESGGGTTVGNTITTTRQTFTATAGQTVFSLSNSYSPGQGQLRVYIDGVRQFPSEYTETNTTSFTLTTGVPAGTIVFAEIDAYVSQEINAASVSFSPTGAISATTVQNALSELDTEKAPLASPSFTGVVSIAQSPVNNNGVLQIGSYASIKSLFETATVTPTAPSANPTATPLDVISQSVQYFTSNTTAAFTFNIRGNSSTTLNSIMQVGQSVTLVALVTCANSTHFATTVQIDGTTSGVTQRWQGAVVPTAGNSSSIDIYSYTVIKTAATPTYTVLASQTRFA